jgi:lipid-A-disaccharide synthase
MIIAGEASGDLYGACLAVELRRQEPTIRLFGMGGDRMRSEGVETLINADDMAVMGLVEVVAHARVIYRAYSRLKAILLSEPPDLLILIDYQEFNQILARVAKKAGVRVFFFISPQFWAWRPGRVKKMARIVDHMAVLFPFEVAPYEREGVPVTFVGHPLLDIVHPSRERGEALRHFGLDPSRRTVGLFPGSRKSEIRQLFGDIVGAAKLLNERYPGLQFILPLAPSLSREDLEPVLSAAGVECLVVEAQGYDVMQVCDAAIAASGTVTLELTLMGVPMVIIYRVSPFTYHMGKLLVKIEHMGICNIVAGERIVPELLQDEVTSERIAREVGRMLTDEVYLNTMKRKLVHVRSLLGSGGCLQRVAEVALTMLGSRHV